MVVICIAHAKVEKFEDPGVVGLRPLLARGCTSMPRRCVCEWSDAVLFATRKIRTQTEDAGFNRKRTIANAIGKDGGERILRCVGGPSCIAKNRYGIAEELPLSWAAFMAALSNQPNARSKPMADLNGFDANNVEPAAAFDPIPAGKYLAVITDSEMKPNKAGTGSYLQLTFQIIEGEYKNRLLWARLNLDNPNATAVQIARAELSAICRAVGVLAPERQHGVAQPAAGDPRPLQEADGHGRDRPTRSRATPRRTARRRPARTAWPTPRRLGRGRLMRVRAALPAVASTTIGAG